MKRILLLSLLLLPIVALAQYPTFSNKQKLGVQTTGDGLIFRGGIHPNYYTPSNINNAYFYLDTTTSKLYLYSVGTWQQIYPTASDTISLGAYLLKSDTSAMLLPYLKKSDTISLSNRINNKLNTTDTVSLSNRINLKLNNTDTINLSNRIDLKLNKSDTISLSNRIDIKLNASDTVSLSNRINTKLDTLYINYPTYIDTITNKDTIQIAPSLVLTEGFGINVIGDSINIDSAVILATQQKQIAYVKNQSGVTMYKGQAVYSSGSSGDNKLVTLASSATEQSSSKTFGVVESDSIPNGGHGYIITFGLLSGINTDALNEGSSIYLSSIPGQLTSVKPIAPLHMVVIGVCIRKQQNNGSIFVKIQNGFELDELHDVRLTDLVDKSSIYYNLSEKLWRDTTAALLVSDTATMLNPYLRKLDTLSLSNRINLKFNSADTSILGYVTTYSNQYNINGNKTFNNTVSVDSLNATKQAKIQSLTVGKGGYAIIGGTPGAISSTAFGFEALKNNTSGDWNTAIGYQALLSNDTGWNNVAIGNNALRFNTGGEYNTAIGVDALDLNVVGNYNTAIGYNSGNGSKGSNNIFIGSNSGHADSVNNVLVIGSASLPLLTGILSGNKKLGVNINPLNITSTFEVNSPISDAVKISSNTNSTNLELANNSGNSVFIKSTNRNMVLQTDTTALMYLNGDNKKVGILTMNPQQELEINGNVRIDSLNNNIVPTRMIGSSNNGDLTNVNLGEGLSFVNDTLKVDLTIIDTAIAASSITLIGNVSGSGSTNSSVTTTIGNGVVTNDMLAGSISDSKLNTITTAGKVSNSATTATSTNTNSAIVTRDGSGNFSAGTITASLNGNASTATNVAYSGLTGAVPIWNQNTTGNAATVTSVLPSNFASQTANTVLAAPNGSSGTPTFRSLVSADIPNLNYLHLTGGTLTGGLTGTNAVFSGSMAIGFPFAYKPLEVFSNVNDFVSVGTNQMTQFQWAGIHFGYRQPNYDYRSSAIVFQRNEIPPFIDATGKIHLLNVSYANSGRSADLRDAKLTISNIGGYVGINDTSPEYQLDVNGTLNATGATTLGSTLAVSGNITEDGNNVLTNLDTASLSTRIDLKLNKTDTASMLTPYFRDADTTSLNLTSRFAAKLNISDTASMLTNYLRTGVAASTYQTKLTNPITGTGTINYLPKFTSTGSTIGSSALINNENYLFVNPNTQSSFGWDYMTNTSNPFIGSNVKNGTAHERLQRQSTTSLFYPSAIIFGYQRVNNSSSAASFGGINFMTTDSDIVGDINPITYSRMFIQPSGNIGIGTMQPSFKLDIQGTLGVTGETTLSNLGGNGNRMVITNDNGVLSTQAIPTSSAEPNLYLALNGPTIVLPTIMSSQSTYFLHIDNVSTVTVTLPTASLNTNKSITIKNGGSGAVNSNANNVQRLTGTTSNIILLSGGGKFATLVSDGFNWITMAAN